MIPTHVKPLITVRPFCNGHSTCIIKKTIDKIEKKELTYPDYAQRKGIMWSDFWVNVAHPDLMEECTDTVKLTQVAGKLQRHYPQSVFNYPKVKNILCREILPKLFALIHTNQWAQLPEKVFAQFFLQRCSASEPMDWHQDPGEDYDITADFSLALMLSLQNDPTDGWNGGEFKIRPGSPTDEYKEEDVATIIPDFNQGIVFNNKINSHSVTQIFSIGAQSKRDLIVIPIYLGNPPKPKVAISH